MTRLVNNLYEFDEFRLDVRHRALLRRKELVPLTPKAFETLLVLVQNNGQLMTKDELMKAVWPDSFVEDANLTQTVFVLRRALGETREQRYIMTLQGQGYRFVADVKEVSGNGHAPADAPSANLGPALVRLPARSGPTRSFTAHSPTSKKFWRKLAGASAVVLVVGLIGYFRWSGSRTPLAEKDTIVLADFANTTGDPVFDEALKQALSVELTQSPFLNVASDLKVSEMLRRMGRSPSGPLTPELAREVCLRLGAKGILAGTISRLGSQYVVGLQMLGCASGDILAAGQAEAANKESVLKVVDEVASQVRGKVGESLASLQKYDFPVDTTTKSLEALKAFSMGLRTLRDRGEGDAIPFFQNAIQLDPDFALAYTTLGRAYEDVGEDNQAVVDFTRAFNLRDRLSERERFYVTALYNETVTGDMERAKETSELWVQTYPRDGVAREKLATIYGELGDVERADLQAQEALRLDPDSAINVFNSVMGAVALNRLDEARTIGETARAHGLDGLLIHETIYPIAFLRGDSAEMERQLAWAADNGDATLFSEHSDTEAYYGRLRKARELSKRAAELATRDETKEMAATCEVAAALREVETGNVSLARQSVRAALSLAPTREVKLLAALVIARTGDTARVQAALKELEGRNPLNTLMNSYWLPTVRASLEVHAGNPKAAISFLQEAAPYEFSETSNVSNVWNMYPVYVRGQAYLLAHNGRAAAAEFRRLLDHRGVVQNSILGALSRLELARAEVLMGDVEDGRIQYSDFLSLWKDADPDIPILREAKAESVKLQSSPKLKP